MHDIEQLRTRVQRLEENFAEQSRLLEQLNEIVTRLNLDSARFEKALAKQTNELREFIDNQKTDPLDEKPPHY